MSWITRSNLKSKVADMLQKADQATLTIADSVLDDAIQRAHLDIISRLQSRQFTQAQIDAWDRRVEYQTDLALFWVFTAGGVPSNFSDTWIKMFDRRAELDKENFRLVSGGVVVVPGNSGKDSTAASITYGLMSNALPKLRPENW